MALDDPIFWTALLKIIGVNIVLSGDNAVVIALAARSLPPAAEASPSSGVRRRDRDADRPHALRGGAARLPWLKLDRLGACCCGSA
jgi:hypothetical protein